MKRGLLVPVIDRAIANVRAIREAPEAITLTAIAAVGISYLVFEQFYSPRVTALTDRITIQERLLTDYRTKLKGATPDEAASQIDKLTSLLADAQKSQGAAKSKPVSVENRSRDPRRLYEDSTPVALTQDPQIDRDRKRITFPVVNAAVILGINKVYEFQDWKVVCGGTRMYNTISDGTGNEYSYSPLTCKIVGNR